MKSVNLLVACIFAISADVRAEIHQNPGGKQPLPHEKYIRIVSENISPVHQIYIKAKDGLYIAAALRKPTGDGPFPAVIVFHGAPGGRGMDQLVGWSRGTTGGPVWERFLQEGYVVIVADYRGGPRLQGQPAPGAITYIDDGVSVVEYVKTLPYVNTNRINLYGASMGGGLVLGIVSRVTVNAAILGAPAPMGFLGITMPPGAPAAGPDRFKDAKVDAELARKNIETIKPPLLILVGTADSLLPVDKILHDMLEAAGKTVRMEIYENGFHDFCFGPQGHKRPELEWGTEVLLDSTLAALEKSVLFLKGELH